MSWRQYLDHSSLTEGASGRTSVDAGCADSHVELTSSMLENAISTYQQLRRRKVYENQQTSFVLKESGEEPMTDEEVNTVSGPDVDAARDEIVTISESLVEARRNNFRSRVEEIATKHTAVTEMTDMVTKELTLSDVQYPIELVVSSGMLNGTIIEDVLEICYEATKYGVLNINPRFETLNSIDDVIISVLNSGQMVTFNNAEELTALVANVKSVLAEVPSILEKIEGQMDQVISAYTSNVLPAINNDETLSAEQIRIQEILCYTITKLVSDLVLPLTENCGSTMINIMTMIHPVIGAAPIFTSVPDDIEEDEYSESDVSNESATGGADILIGAALAALVTTAAMAGSKSVKSFVNYKITDAAMTTGLTSALKMYNNRIDLLKKEVPKLMRAYTPIWSSVSDIMEVLTRGEYIGDNSFVLGRFDCGMLLQIVGNMTVASVDALVKQLVVSVGAPLKLANNTYTIHVNTTVVDGSGNVMSPEAFANAAYWNNSYYGSTTAIDPAKLNVVYTLEFDYCERIMDASITTSSPNLSDRIKKLALEQNKITTNPIKLNESAVMIEATYDNGIKRRIQKVKNLFKHGSYSLRAKRQFTQAELSAELTNAASVAAKEAADLGLKFEPNMEMLEPRLYNLGWIEMTNAADGDKLASKLKYKMAMLEGKSDILRYAIDYVIDTDSAWLDVYASYSEKVSILTESVELPELGEIDEDKMFDNPLDDESDEIEDEDFDFNLDDDDNDEDDAEFVNPLEEYLDD